MRFFVTALALAFLSVWIGWWTDFGAAFVFWAVICFVLWFLKPVPKGISRTVGFMKKFSRHKNKSKAVAASSRVVPQQKTEIHHHHYGINPQQLFSMFSARPAQSYPQEPDPSLLGIPQYGEQYLNHRRIYDAEVIDV